MRLIPLRCPILDRLVMTIVIQSTLVFPLLPCNYLLVEIRLGSRLWQLNVEPVKWLPAERFRAKADIVPCIEHESLGSRMVAVVVCGQ